MFSQIWLKLFGIFLILFFCKNCIECRSVLKLNSEHDSMRLNNIFNSQLTREKRQIDFNIDAEHEEGIGTDLTASASLNLYKSENTRIDGTARYSQHFSEFNGYGKAKIGASIHLTHNY